MRKFLTLILTVTVLLIVLFVFKEAKAPADGQQGESLLNHRISSVSVGGQEIKVKLAITPEEKIQGLSDNQPLKEDEGMLFIFDKPDFYGFWMKGMGYPIDILWLSENSVIDMKNSVLPETFPQTFTSKRPARYVLEVASGTAEKKNLKVGDPVKFLP